MAYREEVLPTIAGGTGVSAAGASGNVLTSDGTNWTSSTPSSGGGIKFTQFTASGTWTKDAACKAIRIIMWGGGSGGGSGRRGASGSARSGGSGGCTAGVVNYFCDASNFGATASVTVGAGGTGAAAITTNDTNGSNGSTAGSSKVGNITSKDYYSYGNGGGTGTINGGAAAYFTTEFSMYQSKPTGTTAGGTSSAGAGSNATALPYDGAFGGTLSAGGGGGGGGIDTSNVSYNGGTGCDIKDTVGGSVIVSGGTAGSTPGGAGGNGNAGGLTAIGGLICCGTGGGGGAAGTTGVGGTGGNGAIPGGAGGGGGASLNGNNSGAGGTGARGEVWIFEYLG